MGYAVCLKQEKGLILAHTIRVSLQNIFYEGDFDIWQHVKMKL